MKLTETTSSRKVVRSRFRQVLSVAELPKQMVMLLLAAGIAAGCSTSTQRAPVIERGDAGKKHSVQPRKSVPDSAAPARGKSQQVHVVQKGETLYSIAFSYGLDYRELADMNGIQDPNVISVGQELRLSPTGVAAGGDPGERAAVAAVRPVAPVESRPLPAQVKEQPVLMKLPYSEAALAQINQPEPARPAVAATVVATAPARAESRPEPKPDSQPEAAAPADGKDEIEWIMPTSGKVIAGFSEADNRKGIDIAGKLGQPVVASAPGKVVYSGSGLRGYGKLVIIKHNNHFISAYAHNDQILVKEGQVVARGQRIAIMGDSDSDRVMLHFEVRYQGKPVDPAKYLPLDQS